MLGTTPKGIKMPIFIIILVLGIGSELEAQTYDEEAPGPHGGYMQRPTNFHTEVIPNKDSSFKIYLLDLELRSSVAKNSKVVAWVSSNRIRTDFQCRSQIDHFHCKGTKTLSTGTLFVRAIRNGVVGAIDATYDLPFKREGK